MYKVTDNKEHIQFYFNYANTIMHIYMYKQNKILIILNSQFLQISHRLVEIQFWLVDILFLLATLARKIN